MLTRQQTREQFTDQINSGVEPEAQGLNGQGLFGEVADRALNNGFEFGRMKWERF
jgi:hypothetical protein